MIAALIRDFIAVVAVPEGIHAAVPLRLPGVDLVAALTVWRRHVYIRHRFRRLELRVCAGGKKRYGVSAGSGHGVCGSVCDRAHIDHVR